jgi:hypothetical protein
MEFLEPGEMAVQLAGILANDRSLSTNEIRSSRKGFLGAGEKSFVAWPRWIHTSHSHAPDKNPNQCKGGSFQPWKLTGDIGLAFLFPCIPTTTYAAPSAPAEQDAESVLTSDPQSGGSRRGKTTSLNHDHNSNRATFSKV